MGIALFTGVSGMLGHQQRLDVIANNIANVNTTAFRGSRLQFQDMLYQTISGASGSTNGFFGTNPQQVGLGVQTGEISMNTRQGTFETTGNNTDMAIEGSGFFVLSDGANPVFTRDGSFSLNPDGVLIDPATGLTVQGYLAGEDGTIDPNAELTTIQLPLGGAAIVQATTEASLIGNLSADPDAPVTLVRNITVFDSLGNERDLLMTFTQQPQINWNGTDYNRWDWEAEYTNNETPPVTTSVGTGTVLFDEFGTYVAEGTVAGGTFTERPANDDEVSIPAAALGTSPTVPDTPFDFEIDFSLLTELAGESDVTISTQDGFPPGTLESFSVSRNGVINGIYTNGLSQVVGQVALATFANDQGLVRLGDNLFEHTSASGLPRIRPSGGAGSGEIIGGVLERSNVDLAAEFSDLIVTQRGFQANARTITTADTLLQEAVNLIR